MQELIQQIADKAGITPEQAAIALQTMQEYMAQHKEQQKEGEDANKNSFFENIKEKAEELFEKAKDSGLAAKAEEVFEKIKKKF
jgi:hypothetical protein